MGGNRISAATAPWGVKKLPEADEEKVLDRLHFSTNMA
jgi:hypothetical protein